MLSILTPSYRFQLFVSALLVSFFCLIVSAHAQPSIAVLELDAKGGVKSDEASIITDRLRAQLVQTGEFQVLERSKMEALLKEQGFQQSVFCDDAKCKAQIGKLLGVEGLVTGSVSRLDTVYILNIRVMDVERGTIIREEFQDCECTLKDVLTQVTPQLVARLLNQQVSPLYAGSISTNSLSVQSKLNVETLAGNGWAGLVEGPMPTANFNQPRALILDAKGEVLVADSQNHRIRKLANNGYTSTLAGAQHGLMGPYFADGPGEQAQFNLPTAMALHPNGNIYIADTDNHRIRVMTPDGTVSTFVGTGVAGYANGNPAVAQFRRPQGIAIDQQGNIYVADTDNHSIRKITAAGSVTTLAGNGQSGFLNGKGEAARFHFPTALAIQKNGDLYLADTFNHSIRKITNGVVSTLAGDGKEGFLDGPGFQAQFRFPQGLAFDSQQNLYIADTGNHRIRKYLADQQVITLAGNGQAAYADGNAAVTQFNHPIGLLFNPQGQLLVADSDNQRIRRIIFN